MRDEPYHIHEVRRALVLADACNHDKCRISTLSLRKLLEIAKDHEQRLVRRKNRSSQGDRNREVAPVDPPRG